MPNDKFRLVFNIETPTCPIRRQALDLGRYLIKVAVRPGISDEELLRETRRIQGRLAGLADERGLG